MVQIKLSVVFRVILASTAITHAVALPVPAQGKSLAARDLEPTTKSLCKPNYEEEPSQLQPRATIPAVHPTLPKSPSGLPTPPPSPKPTVTDKPKGILKVPSDLRAPTVNQVQKHVNFIDHLPERILVPPAPTEKPKGILKPPIDLHAPIEIKQVTWKDQHPEPAKRQPLPGPKTDPGISNNFLKPTSEEGPYTKTGRHYQGNPSKMVTEDDRAHDHIAPKVLVEPPRAVVKSPQLTTQAGTAHPEGIVPIIEGLPASGLWHDKEKGSGTPGPIVASFMNPSRHLPNGIGSNANM